MKVKTFKPIVIGKGNTGKQELPKLVGYSKTGKKVFRGGLSFNIAEFQERNKVSLAMSGVLIGKPMTKGFEGEQATDTNSMFSFGWAGNDPKFYPDATLESVMPKEEDYVGFPYRLISATVVGAGTWKVTDFSNEKVLRKSVPMLAGKPVYKDHETGVDNNAGFVTQPKWSKSFTDSNGQAVPAGIDGLLMIDSKTNPKLVRNMAIGSVYSNSVTVEFDWEMSHEFDDMWDFMNKVGTMGADGQMIRRIVTAIHNYHESSVVWLGADPFAKAYNEEGELKHIDISSVYNFSKWDKEKYTDTEKQTLETQKKFVINFAIPENVLSLKSKTTTKPVTDNQKDVQMNNKFLIAFATMFGASLGVNLEQLNAEELTDQRVQEMLAKISLKDADKEATAQANAALVTALKAKAEGVESLQEHLAKSTIIDTAELTALRTQADFGKAQVELQRAEAIRLYKAAVEEADENVIKLFKEANPEAITGLIKQYAKDATAKFSGTCADCGSKNFSFQSTVVEKEDEDTDPVAEDDFVVPFNQIHADAYYSKKSNFSKGNGE